MDYPRYQAESAAAITKSSFALFPYRSSRRWQKAIEFNTLYLTIKAWLSLYKPFGLACAFQLASDLFVLRPALEVPLTPIVRVAELFFYSFSGLMPSIYLLAPAFETLKDVQGLVVNHLMTSTHWATMSEKPSFSGQF